MDKTRVYLTESLSTKDKKNNSKKPQTSILATIIKVLGYLIIISAFLIGGYLVFARVGIDYFMLVISWISSLIIGIVLIGFAKVINLLQEINNNLKN